MIRPVSSIHFLLIAVLLAGCGEEQYPVTPRDERPLLRISLEAGKVKDTRFVHSEDISDEKRAQLSQSVGPAAKSLRRFERFLRPEEPAYAVAQGALPHDALAQIIRDPASPTPRVVVVTAENVNDAILNGARATLIIDEIRLPDATAKRIITILQDWTLRYDTPEGVTFRDPKVEFFYADPVEGPKRKEKTKILLQRAANGVEAVLPEIGAIRIVPSRRGSR